MFTWLRNLFAPKRHKKGDLWFCKTTGDFLPLERMTKSGRPYLQGIEGSQDPRFFRPATPEEISSQEEGKNAKAGW